MKSFALLLFIAFSLNASAEEFVMLPYALIHDSLDTNLSENEAVYQFDLSDLSPGIRDEALIYSIDEGENQLYDYAQGDTLTILTTPGEHTFQFYGGSEYTESPIMRLPIGEQHRKLYRIHFQRANVQMMLRKPVLYFYPEETTNLSVEVLPKGEFTFTYPNIESGWEFTCTPDGTLQNGEKSYRYLFWESQQAVPESLLEPQKGIVLSGAEAVAYLETQMTAFGMTSAEQADFLTYWGPQMQTKTNLYIYLLFNEVCDAFASLKISPEPTEIARFYVLWSEVPEHYNPTLEPQEVPSMQRNGFTVLEWGGAEVEADNILIEEL
ncbi:MAG: hypothetical protein Crog4KO_13100 [Crocinitomicaceae bacterium]